MSKKDKKVLYIPGVVKDNKGNEITSQRDAWKKEADCGCGIDCCNGTIHLTKDGIEYVGYVNVEGDTISLKVVTKEDWSKMVGKSLPDCTFVTNITDDSLDIAVDTDLTWTASVGVTGYKVSIGTTSGGTDVVNKLDVGNVTTITAGNEISTFAVNTEYFVTIIPYNTEGDKTGCTEISFTTVSA